MTEASMSTYQELQENGELDGARNLVYQAFRDNGMDGTAGGISIILEQKGVRMSTNNVSARICELCAMGLLINSGAKVRLDATGRLQTIYYVHDIGKRFVPMIKKNDNPVFCPHCGKLIM